MTVGELKEILQTYDDNEEVFIKSANSSYVQKTNYICKKTVRAFWGKDYNALIIQGGAQLGQI